MNLARSHSSKAAKPTPQVATKPASNQPVVQRNDVARLQHVAGNSAVSRLVAGRSPGSPIRGSAAMLSGQQVRRTLIQRHLPGVLENISKESVKLRSAMSSYDTTDPSNGDLIAYINGKVSEVSALPGMVTVVDSKPKLVDALADDMVARSPTPTTKDAVMANATQEVMVNGGGGFTAKDGTVVMLASTNDSSALFHELIHVLSADGGVTQLSVTKTQLNEGFTNYFAEALATKYSKTIFPAYPLATLWAKKFATKFGDSVAYNLYFKDNEALLYSTLAKEMKKNLDADKLIHETNKLVKPPDKPAVTKYKATEIGMYSTSGAIKSEDALGVVIKKKITESYFIESTEPGLLMMDKFIFV